MIPEQRLSSENILADFLPPRDVRKRPLEDVELGGVGLNDASQGLQVAVWEAYYEGDVVYVRSQAVAPAPVAVLTRPGLTSFSIAFDQNMQPAVGWETEMGAGLYWFDNTIPGYTDIVLAAGSRNPRCVLDDKRDTPNLIGSSDLLLCYLRDDALFFRAQRDRFTIEYPLGVGFGNSYFEQVGMGRGLRLLMRFQGRRT